MVNISKELLYKRRQIQSDFKSRKYIFDVGNFYEDDETTKMRCICPNGHLFMISWRQWQLGYKCPRCYLNEKVKEEDLMEELLDIFIKDKRTEDNLIKNIPLIKLTIEFIREQFAIERYRLLTESFTTKLPPSIQYLYNRSLFIKPFEMKMLIGKEQQELEYICPRGHKNTISWEDWDRGIRCPSCYLSELSSYKKYGFINVTLEEYNRNLEDKIYKDVLKREGIEYKSFYPVKTEEELKLEFNEAYYTEFDFNTFYANE